VQSAKRELHVPDASVDQQQEKLVLRHQVRLAKEGTMAKSTVTRMWIAGLIVIVVGLLVTGTSTGLMLADGGHFTAATNGNGSTFVPTLDSFFWTMVSLMIVGSSVATVGGILQLAAWVGALVTTYQIPDKTWFVVLLVGGIIGLSVFLVAYAAMIAYFVAGPDSPQATQSQLSALVAPPAQLLPTG
jgi:hypothetical protein